jgi:hypothetical protein
MKNFLSSAILTSLVALFVLSSAVRAEKILVVVEGAYCDARQSSGYAVNGYINDLTAAGNTVYRVNYYPDPNKYYPTDFVIQLFDSINNYYAHNAIQGAVLIGDLPYALIYTDVVGSLLYPSDYFFMDMKDTSNHYTHAQTWSPFSTNSFQFNDTMCDNHAEIWVSRITAHNLYDTTILDMNGNYAAEWSLCDQYLSRLHQRMTAQEPQPKRFVCVGMEFDPLKNLQDLGFDYFAADSVPGWVLWNHDWRTHKCMSDMPSNWQAQLQRGPYGNQNGLSGHMSNGWPALRGDSSRTYTGIASDTFSFEWAGVFEHSGSRLNWFEGNDTQSSGRFGSTADAIKSDCIAWGDTVIQYYHRALADMYKDGGHPKAKFIFTGGCSNLDLSGQNCLGMLYAMMGNGLICFGSTTEHWWSPTDFETYMQYLLNTSGANFGDAYLKVANSKPFPNYYDCYMLFGAGTLTPAAPQGYVKKNIFASFTLNDTATDDNTNEVWGKIKFTSKSVTGGTYNAASTVYNWYDSTRTEKLTSQASIIAYSQNYGDSGITIGGHKFYGPIMIEAAQSGFLSGYIQTTAKQLIAMIPVITGVSTSIKNVKTTTGNWWIDSIYGQVQYSASSNNSAFDQTKATYKWYDQNKVSKVSTPFCTTYSYVGSRDTLGITKSLVKFHGNYFVKATMPGYRWFMTEENTDSGYYNNSTESYVYGFNYNLIQNFGVSGINKRKMAISSTITSFVPTINSSNGCLAIAGTAKDSVGIGGTVAIGPNGGTIIAKDTLMSGSASQRAGVYYGSFPLYYYSFYVFLYQQPDGSIHVRSLNPDYGTIQDTVVVKTGYTTGKTWLKIDQPTDSTLTCSASSNNSTYTQVYKGTYLNLQDDWPYEAGVMYSSGPSSGSVKFVNIKVTKH